MMLSGKGRPGNKRFFYLIAAPTVITVVATAVTIMAVLWWSAKRVNEVSFDRQDQLVTLVLDQSLEEIAYDQESVTVWDDSIVKLREAELDLSWLDNNLGVWLHSYFGHDQVYVLNPKDEPLYAMKEGQRAGPRTFYQVAAPIESLVQTLREGMRTNSKEGLTETALSPGVADLVVVSKRPAIVSVKPVVSDTGAIPQVPGTEFLHISVRFLDGSFISNLEEEYLFSSARFSWTDDKESGERSYAFVGNSGAPIGFFIWTPYAPGSSVLVPLIPALVAALLLVGLIVALLMLRVRRGAMELQASEAQAHHLAFHDVLTGLPNRALFEDRLQQAVAEAKRNPEHKVALLYLDLDRFKQVNDAFGHPAGDDLIRQVALRLSGLVREFDTVARVGGDEFAIIQVGVSSNEDAELLCRRIVDRVRVPFELAGTQVFAGATIGFAVAPSDAADRVELIRKADIALYQAKAAGRGRFLAFSDSMDLSLRQRRAMERDLRAALKSREQLHLHYQPVYAAKSREIAGVEALARWEHPRNGLTPPAVFIPIAEESGLIEPLGEWILTEACQAAAHWPIGKLAVNISAVQLRSPHFAPRVLQILRRTGFNPQQLELEITETALMESACKSSIQVLRESGVRIALDDFGTGYSSISHLREFDVDRVKIDRSFVSGIVESAYCRAIVQAIVDLAVATGLQVTAEGVETQEQSDFLSSIGCDELQGFLFSGPIPLYNMYDLLGVDPSPGIHGHVAA